MGRKAKGNSPKTIEILITPKLGAYLRDLIDEEGYGDDSTNVAKTLIWRAIEELISKNVLDRRKGKYPEEGDG